MVWWGTARWELVFLWDSEVGGGVAGICGDGNVGAENSCDNCWELVLR